jgi:hypothetical protein
MAAENGHLRAVEILLDHSADKEAKFKVRGSSDGNLPLELCYDLTYHIALYTYIRMYMIVPDVWQYLGEEMPFFLLTPIHTSTYVIFYKHVHAYSICMYVCMYVCMYILCINCMYM